MMKTKQTFLLVVVVFGVMILGGIFLFGQVEVAGAETVDFAPEEAAASNSLPDIQVPTQPSLPDVTVEETAAEEGQEQGFLPLVEDDGEAAFIPPQDDNLTADPAEAVDALWRAALDEFIAQVNTGNSDTIAGVFVHNVLALPIRQQPSNNPGYVSTEDGVVTQFGMASQYGSIGILGHNYLAGSLFFDLELGQEVYIVKGDGSVEGYRITELRHFQALQPNSPYSDFLDLDNDNAKLSATDLFYQIYDADDRVVFQTCINANGSSAWGRLFVIAEPITE